MDDEKEDGDYPTIVIWAHVEGNPSEEVPQGVPCLANNFMSINL